MYKRCVTAQSAQRQKELEIGFLNAMLTQRYEDITISSFCQQMGIPRKSFYRYFTSKEGALYALIDHTVLQFTGDFLDAAGGTDSILNTMEEYFLFWASQKKLLNALAHNDLSGILIQRLTTIATSEDQYADRIAPQLSRRIKDYHIIFRVSGLMSLVIQWHKTNFREEAKEMAIIATKLLTEPVNISPL